MATKRFYRCVTCNSAEGVGSLFQALQSVVENTISRCKKCDGRREVVLEFSHGLGIGQRECRVLSAYLPSQNISWGSSSREVSFFPFLVVLDVPKDNFHAVWLPYWHVIKDVSGVKHRYGQWAPFIGEEYFEDLLRQANRDGYLQSFRST